MPRRAPTCKRRHPGIRSIRGLKRTLGSPGDTDRWRWRGVRGAAALFPLAILAGCGDSGGGARRGLAAGEQPGLSVRDASVSEGNGKGAPAVFRVVLSAPSRLPVAVEYATRESSARVGADYQGSSGILELPAGAVEATLRVAVTGDSMDEDDEVFRIVLERPRNGILERAEALGTIKDDDPRPSLAVASVTAREGFDGEAVIHVHLAPESGRTVRVDYETVEAKARAGRDYERMSGTLVFSPGSTEETIRVRLLDDSHRERQESFRLVLRDAINAAIADGDATVTIADDEREEGGSSEGGGDDDDDDDDD